MTRYSLALNILFCIFVAERVNAVSIQFYRNRNFTDLNYESTSQAACNNVPDDKKENKIYSIKTDVCLMVYYWPNCQGYGRKFDLDNSRGWEYKGKPTEVPDVLESYMNVCTCINVPTYVQNMTKWSVNNYGNDFLAYYEPNCSDGKWKAINIPAGHWRGDGESSSIYENVKIDTVTKISYKIQSIGPNPNSTYFRTSCAAYTPQWIMKIDSFENFEQLNSTTNQSGNHRSLSLSQTNVSTSVFFQYPNYRGVHLEVNSSAECHSIPKSNNSRGITNEIGSVKSNACLIFYSENECTGRSIKIYPGGGVNLPQNWEATVTGPKTLTKLYNMFPNWKWITGSFHNCNENEGGLHLNVDITSFYADMSPESKPLVFERYTNVCSCINIPYEVQVMEKWSVDNHGNSMMAYFDHDCMSSPLTPLWIPAGRSSFSMGLGLFEIKDKTTNVVQRIQAFGPDTNSQYFRNTCLKSVHINNITSVIIDGSLHENFVLENSNSQEMKSQKTLQDVLQILSNSVKNLTTRMSQLEHKVYNGQNYLEDLFYKNKEEIKDLSDKIQN